jgi:hypothetical protein
VASAVADRNYDSRRMLYALRLYVPNGCSRLQEFIMFDQQVNYVRGLLMLSA